jgi:hypothetical protein
MRPISRIETLIRDVPDDLLLAASSFEERSVGAVRLLGASYRCRLALLVHVDSSTSQAGEERKRRFSGELYERLSKSALSGRAEVCPAAPHSPFPLWNNVRTALRREGRGRDAVTVTIDISCLTRIQNLFLLRNLMLEPNIGSIRVVYSVPTLYFTESALTKELSAGYSEVVRFPFEIGQPESAPVGTAQVFQRAAFVIVGHEGDRTLNIWRSLDVERTVVFRVNSSDTRRVNMTNRRNEFLLRRCRQGDPSFHLLEVPWTRIEAAEEWFDHALSLVRDDGVGEVNFIPFGPKPVLVAICNWTLGHPELRINIAYSTPAFYYGLYSRGIREVQEAVWSRPSVA